MVTTGTASFRRNNKACLGATVSAALLATLASTPGALALSPDKADPARRSAAVQSPVKLAYGINEPKEKSATPSDLAAAAPGILSIIVSLKSQRLTLYSDGAPVAHSAVSSGKPGHTTPTGVFSIIQKDRWHHSTIYDDAPMYYMQRLTWSGVALHQGIVPNYPASHGCVRLPAAFAHQLWTTTKVGARVIISPDDVTPVAISHPLLFTHKVEQVATKRDTTIAPVKVVEAPLNAFDPTVMAHVRFAENAADLTGGAVASDSLFESPAPAPPSTRPAPLKAGPVSVLISRKEGRLFVRKGFEPVFSAPVTFEPTTNALGTHVFTAYAARGDGDALRWTAVSVANAASKASSAPLSATEALDHVKMPQDAADRIASLVSAGASIIVTDRGLGPETGVGTDFIVLTH